MGEGVLKLSLLGVFLLAVTVLIHAVGTTYWVRHLRRRYAAATPPGAWGLLSALVTTAVLLLGLHIVEVTIWAVVYLAALPASDMWTLEKALYFSLVTFTTLGYGDITLSADWRVLSGIEALNGILLVGWSTAMLFTVLQKGWQMGVATTRPSDQTGETQ